jgi:hypothetical protein
MHEPTKGWLESLGESFFFFPFRGGQQLDDWRMQGPGQLLHGAEERRWGEVLVLPTRRTISLC